MSAKAEQVKKRYLRGWVTDAQLLRYFELGAITEDEYNEIKASKE